MRAHLLVQVRVPLIRAQDRAPRPQTAAWEGGLQEELQHSCSAHHNSQINKGLSLSSAYLIPLIAHCKFTVALTVTLKMKYSPGATGPGAAARPLRSAPPSSAVCPGECGGAVLCPMQEQPAAGHCACSRLGSQHLQSNLSCRTRGTSRYHKLALCWLCHTGHSVT